LLRWAWERPSLVGGFVLVVCGCGLAVAVRALWADPIDLEVYHAAGAAVLERIPLYDGPLVDGLQFVYTPLAALWFIPLAPLPMGVAQGVCVLANCFVLVFCTWRSWRSVGLGSGRTTTVLTALMACGALAFEPVHATLYVGQVNLMLLAIVLWDVLRDDRHRTKGIGVGLAAGIKLTPMLFVLYLVVTRRFRAAGMAMASFLGTVALGFTVLPADSAKFWLTGLFADSTRIWPDAGAPQNVSLNGMLMRLVGPPGATNVLWLGLAGMLVARTIVVAARAGRQSEPLLGVTLFGLCASAVSPWSWGHHWVWVVPLAVFAGNQILCSTDRTRSLIWAPSAVLTVLLFLPAFFVPPPGQSPAQAVPQGPFDWVLGNIYLLLFVTTLISGSLHLRQARMSGTLPADR
jgi:alpha-1,2-mannosyltransferase